VSVVLGSFFCMMFGMKMMTLGDVRMVGSLFMITSFMMLGGFFVVLRRVSVVLGSHFVMLVNCICHFLFPLLSGFVNTPYQL
jgi:hypothetical protein